MVNHMLLVEVKGKNVQLTDVQVKTWIDQYCSFHNELRRLVGQVATDRSQVIYDMINNVDAIGLIVLEVLVCEDYIDNEKYDDMINYSDVHFGNVTISLSNSLSKHQIIDFLKLSKSIVTKYILDGDNASWVDDATDPRDGFDATAKQLLDKIKMVPFIK